MSRIFVTFAVLNPETSNVVRLEHPLNMYCIPVTFAVFGVSFAVAIILLHP